MPFISPALASPLDPAKFKFVPGEWVAEEKYDGHRLIVEVSETGVRAWSRDNISRVLPKSLVAELANLPPGVYDGELISGDSSKSYDVQAKVNAERLAFVVFDMLMVDEHPAHNATYDERRALLVEVFANVERLTKVMLSYPIALNSVNDIQQLAKIVWNRGGEGLIIKHRASKYEIGKRMKTWLKVKALENSTLTITGYKAGKLGPCSVVIVTGDDGISTTVKAKNDKLRNAMTANPMAYIGKKLRIEHNGRTPERSYRHPRWDHLVED